MFVRITNHVEREKVKKKLRMRTEDILYIQNELSKKDGHILKEIRIKAKAERENNKNGI